MQPLTAAPRDSLTVTQVVDLLTGAGVVRYDRGLEVLDASLNVVGDLTADFQGGSVVRTMNATIHGTCNLNVASDIDYGTQLVRPYMTVSDGLIEARFNLGVYRLVKPQTDYSTSPITNAVTGSDRLVLLDRPVGDAYVVASGTGYLDAVRTVWADAGMDPATLLLDGTAAASVLPTAQSWPLLATGTTADVGPADATGDAQQATTWLRIINDLLAAISYRGLWCDWDGLGRSGPYATPSERAVEFTFDFDDLLRTVVAIGRTKALSQTDIVNKWIFQQSNLVDGTGEPVEATEGAGQYTVTNSSTGPTSVDAQGGLEWVSVVQLDAADQASLVAQGDAVVSAALADATVFSVSTAPFPAAWHWDVYSYSDVLAAGGAVKVEETEWTLSLGDSTTPPADMTRIWAAIA